MHLPPGFNTVTAYFFVKCADAYIDFLIRGLNGVEVLRHKNGNRITNAQVRIGNSTVMLSEASTEFPATQSAHYLYVENADLAMSIALSAGAIKIMEVANMPYKDRQGGIKDPEGNIWWLSERLIEGSY